MSAIHLLPVGDVPEALARRLAAPLESRFATLVVVDAPFAPRPEWFDFERRQYRAAALLQALINRPPEDGGWRLALLNGELFGPGVESACGLSTLGGCCGIVALAPLDPAREGRADPELFFRRVLTETVHEIGHIVGLTHCPDERCVMHYSGAVDDTDRKGPDFCAACRR